MAYIDKYGVEFSDDKTILVKVPTNYSGIYEIPYGTISVGYDAFKGCSLITTIVIPATIEDVFNQDEDFNFLASCKKLAYFVVDSQNKYYYTIEGILCLKGIKENFVVAYPPAKYDDFYLPNDVKLCSFNENFNEYDAWGLALHCTPRILRYLKIDETNPNYILKNGALYNKHLEYLIKVSIDEKQYIMPNSVTKISKIAFRGCSKLKKIGIGMSFKDWDGDWDMTYIFRDCQSLESVDVQEDNERFYSSDGILSEHYNYDTWHSRILFAPHAMRKKVYEINDDVADYAFANCRNIQNFKIDHCRRIGCDAFINTAFYNNSQNWDGDFLYAGKYLIKVSENYNKSILVIPSTTHVIVDGSITNSNITDIEILEGCIFFNSSAVQCPNLKTIKFPGTLWGCYLSEHKIFKSWNNGSRSEFPLLEKILIPKGMRDFFLSYTQTDLYNLLVEYDKDGVETPIMPLSKEEWQFYNSKHPDDGGFPNYVHYSTIEKELLTGFALSEEQIWSLLPSDIHTFEKYGCQISICDLKCCFEKNGYKFNKLTYKNENGEDIKLYNLEPDPRISILRSSLVKNQVITGDVINVYDYNLQPLLRGLKRENVFFEDFERAQNSSYHTIYLFISDGENKGDLNKQKEIIKDILLRGDTVYAIEGGYVCSIIKMLQEDGCEIIEINKSEWRPNKIPYKLKN